jgi:hypothetical protein
MIFNFDANKLQKYGINMTIVLEKQVLQHQIAKREDLEKQGDANRADINMYTRKICFEICKNFITSSKGFGYKIDVVG